MSHGRAALLAVFVLGILMLGCASTPPRLPYPHESVLTVLAEFKLALARDPYREPPLHDLAGGNVFRATLDRLDEVAPHASDAMQDVIAYARAACLMRLGDYDAAAELFQLAAGYETELASRAREKAQACEGLVRILRDAEAVRTLQEALDAMQAQEEALGRWAETASDSEAASLARLEQSRLNQQRVALMLDHRRLLPQGATGALEAAEAGRLQHAESWQAMSHMLLLGACHEALARDWTRLEPPETRALWERERWAGWVSRARDAYRAVARADGDPFKPEGVARLEALEAYALRIERARR